MSRRLAGRSTPLMLHIRNHSWGDERYQGSNKVADDVNGPVRTLLNPKLNDHPTHNVSTYRPRQENLSQSHMLRSDSASQFMQCRTRGHGS